MSTSTHRGPMPRLRPRILALLALAATATVAAAGGSATDAPYDETLAVSASAHGEVDVSAAVGGCHDGAVDVVGLDAGVAGGLLQVVPTFRDRADVLDCWSFDVPAFRERTLLYGIEVLDPAHPLKAVYLVKVDTRPSMISAWYWRDGGSIVDLAGSPAGDHDRADLPVSGADPGGRAYDLSGASVRVTVSVDARYTVNAQPFFDAPLRDEARVGLTVA